MCCRGHSESLRILKEASQIKWGNCIPARDCRGSRCSDQSLNLTKFWSAEPYLTITSCLEEFLWTFSYQTGLGDLIQLCLCLLDMQTLGKCFFIQPNYTLQAKANLLSPECPSPPSFAPARDKTEGVKPLHLNGGQFAFYCVVNSSCRATEKTKHLIWF